MAVDKYKAGFMKTWILVKVFSFTNFEQSQDEPIWKPSNKELSDC